MADDTSGIVRSLGVTPEQLVGYAYTGFLSLACLAIVDTESVKNLSDAVGAGLLIVIAIAIGVAGFTFYFKIVGELMLFPLQYLLHHWLDRVLGRKGERHTATLSFLNSLGVPWLRCHAAYQELKSNFYSSGSRSQIQLTHGELHVLYVTATTLIGFSVYAGNASPYFDKMLLAGLISLVAALIADTIQQSIETHALRSADHDQLLSFLSQRGLLTKASETPIGPIKNDHSVINSLAHLGIVSNDVNLFESFWCEIVGFRKVWESELSAEKALALFGAPTSAKIVRYSGFGDTQLEVHVPVEHIKLQENSFMRHGLNHLCIELSDRENFMRRLPETVRIHRYKNPGGWENMFVQDFDGNWLEIRQRA